MADELLTDKDDDEIEIVEVETLPEPGKEPVKKEEPEDDEEPFEKSALPEDDEDDDDEDERLADRDSDEEESPQRKKRLKRRQLQKEAKERTLLELDTLRREKAELERRVSAIETGNFAANKNDIDRRLSEVRQDVETAAQILAKAIEAGNGVDAATALRLRDEARDAERDLIRQQESLTQRREAPNTTVVSLVNQWKQANPWYDPKGGDDDSAIVNAIDNRLAAEGYDPASRDYWTELTKRVSARLGGQQEEKPARERVDTTVKKKAPPMGNGREHAPQSTRKEVYVTPERKQAMMDAGMWDDPVARNKMLKTYAAYDRNESENRR